MRDALASPPSGIGSKPTKSVSQQNGGSFQLRVLVQEVIELPRLITDPEVVALVATTSWNSMKFATRISSMRRSAWKQCRSCSADSDSMWLDSLARCRARRMDALALRLEDPGDRILGEPVDLESGCRRRSSRAIATSRCAWPSPIGEETYRARGQPSGRDNGVPRGPSSAEGSLAEVAQGEVDLHRLAGARVVPEPSTCHEGAVPARLRAPAPLANG